MLPRQQKLALVEVQVIDQRKEFCHQNFNTLDSNKTNIMQHYLIWSKFFAENTTINAT